jgi:hypothetical protein
MPDSFTLGRRSSFEGVDVAYEHEHATGIVNLIQLANSQADP